MTIEETINLNCKKHVKIYKLKQLELSNKQIAEMLKTNQGHVYNVLKSYAADPSKVEKANAISN